MIKKLISIIFSLVIIVSTFVACGSDSENETITSEHILQTTETTVNTQDAKTTESSTDVTTSVAVDNDLIKIAGTYPQTKKDIVEYFNIALNAVKVYANSVNLLTTKIYMRGPMRSSSVIGDIAGKLFSGTSETIKPFRHNTDIYEEEGDIGIYDDWEGESGETTNLFPIANQNYSSLLTVDDVVDVTFTPTKFRNQDAYLIKITTAADDRDSNISTEQSHASKVFDVGWPTIHNDGGTFKAVTDRLGDAEFAYDESNVTAWIEFETGKVLFVQYRLNWTAYFGNDLAVPLAMVRPYEIYWGRQ